MIKGGYCQVVAGAMINGRIMYDDEINRSKVVKYSSGIQREDGATYYSCLIVRDKAVVEEEEQKAIAAFYKRPPIVITADSWRAALIAQIHALVESLIVIATRLVPSNRVTKKVMADLLFILKIKEQALDSRADRTICVILQTVLMCEHYGQYVIPHMRIGYYEYISTAKFIIAMYKYYPHIKFTTNITMFIEDFVHKCYIPTVVFVAGNEDLTDDLMKSRNIAQC